MIRIIIALTLAYQLAFAFFSPQSNHFSNCKQEVQTLKSLDIDSTFLKDTHYNKMKDDLNDYKTKYFLNVLKKGYEFIPILKKILHDSDIPDAFLYMAMVESKFSTKAYSNKQAAGIWQFVPYTAKKFNLKINKHIDERLDPVKSTQAAAKYLSYLHKRFKKWYLVALAYNCGEGRVARAIKKAKTDDLTVLIDPKKKYIPRESRNYIRKIVLMSNLANNKDIILRNDADYLLNSSLVSSLKKVTIDTPTTLNFIAKSIGMSLKELKNYNAHIKRNLISISKNKYYIYLPEEKVVDFEAYYDTEEAKKVAQIASNKKVSAISKKRIYIIKKGDSLSKVARKFKAKVKTIMQANNLNNSFIKVGKKIVIP